MSFNRSVTLALVFALLAAMSFIALAPDVATAAPQYSELQQPPAPSQPPTTNEPGVTGSVPPQPSSVPAPGQPLPDPTVATTARSESVSTTSIAFDELEVSVDRGCPSQYKLNDPIQFIARRGSSQQYGYWTYMEIWNSTNNAWWTKLAADWVAPNGSMSRSGRIAEPTGMEQLYSRLIDQYGNVLDETWCDYQSSTAPTNAPIQCNQTMNRSLNLNEQHKWSFYGNGGRSVRISMQGPQGLDTYIELRSPNGSLIASNDDINAPYDLNSRMQVRLPSTGTYTIVARGFKYQAGEYALSVFCD